jgi:hypothetical protein
MSKPRRDGTPAPVDISAAIRHNLDAAREIGNSVSDGECDARTTMFICASIFADKMVDVAASSQKLSLLKAHFSAVGRAVFMAAMPDEEAVRLLHDDVKDIYAVAGMDSLGIGFSPITLAADEDYDNHNGRNYLNFISTVCRMTDRSRMAAKFGDFQTYQFLAASQQDLQKLVTASRNWDCGFELVSSKPVREGQSVPLKAMVDTTLTLEELQLLLDEVKLPFMRDSVKLVSN